MITFSCSKVSTWPLALIRDPMDHMFDPRAVLPSSHTVLHPSSDNLINNKSRGLQSALIRQGRSQGPGLKVAVTTPQVQYYSADISFLVLVLEISVGFQLAFWGHQSGPFPGLAR